MIVRSAQTSTVVRWTATGCCKGLSAGGGIFFWPASTFDLACLGESFNANVSTLLYLVDHNPPAAYSKNIKIYISSASGQMTILDECIGQAAQLRHSRRYLTASAQGRLLYQYTDVSTPYPDITCLFVSSVLLLCILQAAWWSAPHKGITASLCICFLHFGSSLQMCIRVCIRQAPQSSEQHKYSGNCRRQIAYSSSHILQCLHKAGCMVVCVSFLVCAAVYTLHVTWRIGCNSAESLQNQAAQHMANKSVICLLQSVPLLIVPHLCLLLLASSNPVRLGAVCTLKPSR